MYKNSNTKKVLFIGIPDMAYICLDGLNSAGINIIGVVGPKKSHPAYSDFKQFNLLRKLNFIEYDNLNDIFFIDTIKKLEADIAVVCSFNDKIPKILLQSVKDGFINVHPSLLPKYRGANPYSAVIINGEKETGVTLHFMDKNFDTGDIIYQEKISVSAMETMGTLFNRLNILGLNMLVNTLAKYESIGLTGYKQPEGDFVKGNALTNNLSMIDYTKSAEEIERFIRGLNPFIGAITKFRDNFVKIFSAEVINEKVNELPGTITKTDKDKFYIASKEGLLAPSALQFGSFFVGNSKDFIRILDPKTGEKFI
jgi:methionyl-tRNA formyltransferase